MAPRHVLPLLVGALLLVLGLAVRGEADAPRLRGSVACLDCAAGHDLSGVVVAVRCADGGGAGLLRAAQTDARGAFDVAMPAAVAPSSSAPATPCAARVLGATEQLCAPRGLAVARVVPDRAPGPSSSSSSYALGSPLAFFTTRCRPASGGSAAAATMDAPDQQRQRDAPRVPPEARPAPPAMQAPVGAPPRAGGITSPPPFGVGGGLPLIFFFPFIPIIGIP
ncbi:hypothetical protein GQ55_1G251200 [Panicum hallii var. hallii]|uniref:Uncharacterized protein n=1 Tax=Panicum hallii var. hallii TaxID=1504633 RepID=A0A2T7F790_9POAL|nr:hypothetical protein GQ55_1G251200 [Panicum hallii var. hallii]